MASTRSTPSRRTGPMSGQARSAASRQAERGRTPADLQRQLGNRGVTTALVGEAPDAAEVVAAVREPGSTASASSGPSPGSAGLPVQPKLTVSAPGDPWELEADRVADRAVRGQQVDASPALDAGVSRMVGPSEARAVNGSMEARIDSVGGGRPLPDGIRRDMESAFDADFSSVRLHDSPQDRRDAEDIGAEAFTHKEHIWVGGNRRADDRGLLAHELTHVIQQGVPVGAEAQAASGTGPNVRRGHAPDVQGAWYNVGIPFTDYEFDPSWSGVKTAAGVVKDAAVDVGHGIKAAGEKVWDVATVMWQVAKVLANGAVNALVMLIEAPGKALEFIKGFVGGLVAKAPDKLNEILAQYVAPRLGRATDATTSPDVRVQRQAEATPSVEYEPETRWQAVRRHLGVRLRYMKDNWWQVIKDAALEILVPGLALYRNFPTMIRELADAYRMLVAGEYAASFDHVLATARAAMAIVGAVFAQFSLIAFIIGSIIGTPVVGVAVLEGIGLAVIAVDVAVQLVSMGQSIDNLDRPRSLEQHESDYGQIADSSIALVMLAVLVALGAIASAAVKSLLRRFPGLAAAAESARARIRARLGGGARGSVPVTEPVRPPPLGDVEAGAEGAGGSASQPARSRGATASGTGEDFIVEEHGARPEPVVEKRPAPPRPAPPASTAPKPVRPTVAPGTGSAAEDVASVLDEATEGTARGGRSPSDPEELNASPDRRLVSDEEVEAVSRGQQRPYRPEGATPPPPRGASPTARRTWLLRRLQQHVDAARARFEVEGYTPNQELDIRTNPSAAPRHRGSRIDAFAKDSVMNDPDLADVITAPDMVPEPDFLDSALRTPGDDWFDATTTKSWQAHLRKYFTRYGGGGFLDAGRLAGPPSPTGETNL
jgi:hypothetical protein